MFVFLYLEQLRAVAYVMAVDIEVLKSSSLPGTAANPLSVGPPPRGRTMLNLSGPASFLPDGELIRMTCTAAFLEAAAIVSLEC